MSKSAAADELHDFNLCTRVEGCGVPQGSFDDGSVEFNCEPFRFEAQGGYNLAESSSAGESPALRIHCYFDCKLGFGCHADL